MSPGFVISPLLIVLGVTALKGWYEDINRHRSDRRVGSTRILEGGDFVNNNVTERKGSNLFRGLVPRSLRKRPQVVRSRNPGTQKDATPPEAIGDQENPEGEYDDRFEYDYPPGGMEGHKEGHNYHFSHRGRHENLPRWRKARWEDTKVGDFVKIYEDEPIPADIIICATSEEENVAFVETRNLDGETNLKFRTACPALTHLRNAQECADSKNSFRIDCERPDNNMYRLTAVVTTPDDKYPIDLSQALLRGTTLRDTKWVIGLVIYTGEDTKIALNSGSNPSKRSRVERQMNPQV